MRFAVISFFCLFFVGSNVFAQFSFKTEYFGTSAYRKMEGDTDRKVGDSKGSSVVYQGGIHLPLSLKLTESMRPVLWGMSLGGAYASLHNRNFTEEPVLDEIMNLGISVYHLRPISPKWSLMALLGGGIYAPTSRFSQIRWKQVLGNGGAIFICHLTSNLDLGGGIALNNSFGYPMAFPALYLDWKTSGRIAVKVSMLEGLELSATYHPGALFSVGLVTEMNGQMALLEREGKDQIFTHQYIVVGLRPQFKLGNRVSIPLTAGFHAMRTAEFSDRSLKALFQDKEYYFQISPYVSAGLKVDF